MRHQGKFFVSVAKWNVRFFPTKATFTLSFTQCEFISFKLMTKYNDLVHAQKAHFQLELHPKQFYCQEWNLDSPKAYFVFRVQTLENHKYRYYKNQNVN